MNKSVRITIGAALAGLLAFAGNMPVRAETAVATVTVGRSPSGVAANSTTNRFYVTNASNNTVSVINGSTNAVVATPAVGSFPHGIAANITTNRVYVANSGANSVSVLDGSTNTVVATVQVGGFPYDVGVNPYTNRVYVANADDNTVSVVDGGTNAVVATVAVGAFPANIGINTSTNQVYVSNQFANTVSVIDGATNAVLGTVAVGASPNGIAVNSTTNYAYVANGGSGTVSVISGATRSVVANIAVGSNPNGVAVNAANNRVYVTNASSKSVSVIDGGTRSVVATMATGAYPYAIAANSSTARVYTANTSAGTSTVFDGPTGTAPPPSPATKVIFTTQPVGGVAGQPLATQPVVAAVDSNGNIVTTYTTPIQVALQAGAGTAGAVLSGTTTLTPVNGIVRFTDLSVNLAGTGYLLYAASTGLTTTGSAAFNVSSSGTTVGPATKIVFKTQPVGGNAGQLLTTQPVVAAVDANGNTVTTFNGTATVGLEVSTNPQGAVLSGTRTINIVNGVATYSGLSINLAGTGYLMYVTTSGLTATDSARFNVGSSTTTSTATKVAFVTQPVGGLAGQVLATQPAVAAVDASGNVVTTFNGTIAVSLAAGTSGSALSGTTTLTAVNGIATFTNLSVSLAGTGYYLLATSTGLNPVYSSPFNVGASSSSIGPATKIVFKTQPVGGNAGQLLATQPVVAAVDANGNTVTTFNGTATVGLEVSTNPQGAVLSGTRTINIVNGVATYSGLSINLAGTGYLMYVTTSGLTATDSARFNVGSSSSTVGPATKIVFKTQPVGGKAGQLLATQPVVAAVDANGNTVTTFNGTAIVGLEVSSNPQGAVMSGNRVISIVNGVATYSGLSINLAGTGYLMYVTTSGLTATDSVRFNVG